MAQSTDSAANKRGLPPGTLVHVGESRDFATRISVIDYNSETFDEHVVDTIEDLLRYKDRETTTWISVEGVHDVQKIQAIGDHFGVHPLVLEDIMNTEQRPKMEDYEDYLYIVLKRLVFDTERAEFNHDQVSILLLNGIVITFRELVDDLFEPIKRRLRESRGRFRGLGSDYLAYILLDIVVDQYFLLADVLDPVFEEMEDELLTNATHETLVSLQRIKREMIYVRRGIAPLREMLAALVRSDSELIQERTRVYLQDVHDHAIRVYESMESYRDFIADMLDIYLSSVSNRMNEVMKLLTVFATIFIPLTFIVGVYGMNFEYMPELKWRWSYPTLWVVMLGIIVGLLYYFRRRRWL